MKGVKTNRAQQGKTKLKLLISNNSPSSNILFGLTSPILLRVSYIHSSFNSFMTPTLRCSINYTLPTFSRLPLSLTPSNPIPMFSLL